MASGTVYVLTGYEKDELQALIENAETIEDIKLALIKLLEVLPSIGY